MIYEQQQPAVTVPTAATAVGTSWQGKGWGGGLGKTAQSAAYSFVLLTNFGLSDQ
jgi:hypothetical protein